MLHLKWEETGCTPLPDVSGRKGFGTVLEKAALQGLNGSISRDWRSDGLLLTIEISLADFGKS